MPWFLWAVVALILYQIMKRVILETFEMSRRRKYIFITGCDSGFGRRLAIRLLKTGVNVFAGCYTEQGGEGLKKDWLSFGTKTTGELTVVPIDVSNDESVVGAKKIVEDKLNERHALLHGIVNNAGIFTTFGPDDWCSTEEYMTSLNINTLGAVRVCHAFVPLLKISKGRIVTMGSTAGRLHGLYVAPYVTAKFAVEAYMDCLRLELRQFGVSVHILEPGAFKTELLSEEANHNRLNRIWNRLPNSVKEEYGEQYLNNFKIAWQTGVNIIANPNLDWVVSCYEHALFALWPRLRYAPGWDAIFCFIPLSVVPTYVQDTVLAFMYSLQPGPSLVPAVLKRTKDINLNNLWNLLLDFRRQLGFISCGLAYLSVKTSVLFGTVQAEPPVINCTSVDDR